MTNEVTGTRLGEYEAGLLDESETVELFQQLVNTGLAWQLQGHYGRTAMAYLEAGLIRRPRVQNSARRGR